MVRAGILPPGTTLTGSYGGETYSATVNAYGQVVLPNGDIFDKPEQAAQTASGRRQDGLGFWKVDAVNGMTLRQIRDSARNSAPRSPSRSRS
jgi:hypothetical protein